MAFALRRRLVQTVERRHLHPAHEPFAHPGHQVGGVGWRVDGGKLRPEWRGKPGGGFQAPLVGRRAR